MATKEDITRMRDRITDEIFYALGLKRFLIFRKLFGRLFYLPTQRFAKIFASADDAVGRSGMSGGCQCVVEGLNVGLEVYGEKNIPTEGPLLLVANHPGAYDSVSLGAQVHRQDLKIIAYETGFYRAMPKTDPWFIYTTGDTAGGMLALRSAIQHLRSGGSILQFGSGTIEPDPSLFANAKEAFNNWSHSLEIMLRKAPETAVVLAMASGVLLRKFAFHPLTRLRTRPIDQRRLAEFMQVIYQLIFPNKVQIKTSISFAPPVTAKMLESESTNGKLMEPLLARAQQLLHEHMDRISEPSI